MMLVHSISDYKHPNCKTLQEILDYKGVITFDGIYESVYANKDALKDKECILFIMGGYIGLDNSFDQGKHFLEKYCTWDQLLELKKQGMQWAWHTWSHRDLTRLSNQEVEKELYCPFQTDWFAYPYGSYNERVKSLVAKAGYRFAVAVGNGNNESLSLKRI